MAQARAGGAAYPLGNFLARSLSPETSVGAVLDVELTARNGRTVVSRFAYRATEVRQPGHVVTPVDSAHSAQDAAAWAVARRVLGSSLVAWDGTLARP